MQVDEPADKPAATAEEVGTSHQDDAISGSGSACRGQQSPGQGMDVGAANANNGKAWAESPGQARSKPVTGGGGRSRPICQVPGCGKDLSSSRGYHQRYKICDEHFRVHSIELHGQMMRFCQQCGKFQPLEDFNEDRRSCSVQLALHAGRRRKRHAMARARKLSDALKSRILGSGSEGSEEEAEGHGSGGRVLVGLSEQEVRMLRGLIRGQSSSGRSRDSGLMPGHAGAFAMPAGMVKPEALSPGYNMDALVFPMSVLQHNATSAVGNTGQPGTVQVLLPASAAAAATQQHGGQPPMTFLPMPTDPAQPHTMQPSFQTNHAGMPMQGMTVAGMQALTAAVPDSSDSVQTMMQQVGPGGPGGQLFPGSLMSNVDIMHAAQQQQRMVAGTTSAPASQYWGPAPMEDRPSSTGLDGGSAGVFAGTPMSTGTITASQAMLGQGSAAGVMRQHSDAGVLDMGSGTNIGGVGRKVLASTSHIMGQFAPSSNQQNQQQQQAGPTMRLVPCQGGNMMQVVQWSSVPRADGMNASMDGGNMGGQGMSMTPQGMRVVMSGGQQDAAGPAGHLQANSTRPMHFLTVPQVQGPPPAGKLHQRLAAAANQQTQPPYGALTGNLQHMQPPANTQQFAYLGAQSAPSSMQQQQQQQQYVYMSQPSSFSNQPHSMPGSSTSAHAAMWQMSPPPPAQPQAMPQQQQQQQQQQQAVQPQPEPATARPSSGLSNQAEQAPKQPAAAAAPAQAQGPAQQQQVTVQIQQADGTYKSVNISQEALSALLGMGAQQQQSEPGSQTASMQS